MVTTIRKVCEVRRHGARMPARRKHPHLQPSSSPPATPPLTLDGPEVSTGARFAEALPLPRLLDNEGGGTKGYDKPLEGTPKVGRSMNDKLDGGLVTLVDAEADEAADDDAAEDDEAEKEDEYEGEKKAGELEEKGEADVDNPRGSLNVLEVEACM